MRQLLFWVGFHILIFSLLAFDLVFRERARKKGMINALLWTGFWIGLSLSFNVFVYFGMGKQAALEFFTGYLIEKSLSMDNIFVFLLIFLHFKVPHAYQTKVLFYGIIGAFFMRIIFILGGVVLVAKFSWLLYLFGAFLCITAIRLLCKQDKTIRPKQYFVIRLIQKFVPLKEGYYEGKFFLRERGKLYMTSLFAVLLMIEIMDVIFATDSIPAIFAVTKSPFIIYTSNVFAILGLRSLYFVLIGMHERFRFLNMGIAAILLFTGLKMLTEDLFHIPISVSLGIIAGILTLAILCSLLLSVKRERRN